LKRNLTDVLRRGFENFVANWPLVAIRLGESIVLLVMVVVAIIAAVVPVFVSLGLNRFDPRDADAAAELLSSILLQHWPVLIYIFLLATVVMLLFVAVHSFVSAGVARVYVDAERATAVLPAPQRNQFRLFTGERWLRGGREGWWQVFWIYNIAWGVAGLILLIPLTLGAIVMVLFRHSEGALVAAGCGTLLLTLLLAIVVGIVTNLWSQKAIVVHAATHANAAASLGLAWTQFVADAGRHILLAVIIFVVMMAGSSFFAGFSFMAGWNDSVAFNLAMAPLQMIGSFANAVFSAAVTNWFIACLATITANPGR
jgi:hypothetical protein